MLTGCFLEHSSDTRAAVEDDTATATETARKRVLNIIARRVGFDRFSAALQTVIDGPFFVAANRLQFRSSATRSAGSGAAGGGSGAGGSPATPVALPHSSWVANTDEDNAADGAVLGMDAALLFDPHFVRFFRRLRATVNRTMIDAYTGGGVRHRGDGRRHRPRRLPPSGGDGPDAAAVRFVLCVVAVSRVPGTFSERRPLPSVGAALRALSRREKTCAAPSARPRRCPLRVAHTTSLANSPPRRPPAGTKR